MDDAIKLKIAIEALEYYAAHPSVIKEAFHGNDQRHIVCVHTFISQVARDALNKINAPVPTQIDDIFNPFHVEQLRPGDPPPYLSGLP